MSARPPPRLLVCGFGPFPGVPDNPAAAMIRRLQDEAWAPADAEAVYREIPTTWSGAVPAVADAMRGAAAHGVLLLGVASGAESFRVEMRAVNAASEKPDAEGRLFPRRAISPLGPAVARATAPVEPMVAALHRARLPAYASSDAGDYLCNYTFYRVLTEIAGEPRGPFIAFLHLPPVREDFGLDRIDVGVRAVAAAFARTLAFGHLAEPVSA
jgi:pyroglutamyl-peptidase